jgi:hypothetical protein
MNFLNPLFKKKLFSSKKIHLKGVTIVELLIAFSIMTMIMAVVYQIFGYVFKGFEKITIVELDRRVRLVMEHIRNDLRKACTRGSVLPDSPIGTKFFKIIVEDPDTQNYGLPVDMFGERDYIHGRTLKFFKFSRPPINGLKPQASMVKYTFVQQTINGKLNNCVVRQESFDSTNVQSKILAQFEQNDEEDAVNAFLYFVLFTVDEVTPALIQAGLAKPEELATGGRIYVRIYFRATQKGKHNNDVVELVTVVDPRQINNFEKETDWKQNSNSKFDPFFDLLPSPGA